MDFKQISKALGCEHQWIDETKYVEGVDFIPGNYALGWGFQEGEKNPRWSGGKQAYEDRRNAFRRTPEMRVIQAAAQNRRRDKDREAYNEYQRQQRAKDLEKGRLYAQAYRDKNRDAYNKQMREYRARKRAA